MGSCICKGKNDEVNDSDNEFESHTAERPENRARNVCALERCANESLSETVDKLINETLDVISTIVDNQPEQLSSILMLHMITDKPSGWIELVRSLMRVVPIEHPMGPSVIALLLDDSPLPSRESVLKVSEMITNSLRRSTRKECNLCVILGCLAEKLAGPSSVALLNDTTLNYLVGNLEEKVNINVKLLSLIALEKLAQTSENKATIKKMLAELEPNPLLVLEEHAAATDFLLRQLGFCARWCLDNYFLVKDRKFSYETTDVADINVMLNTRDVSEYLKISPDGLEARCDSYSFESVRCTFQTTSGCWYYEVLIITPGVMQIGWATKESNFLSDDGCGIGDDKYSVGFDGCRNLIWHSAKSTPHKLPLWRSGSILGCLLDLEKREVVFSLNGETTDPYNTVFNSVTTGFFAAASFMSFQQCRFNFGLQPFHYPPKRPFQSFNMHGSLTPQEKVVLPRHIYLDILRKTAVEEDSCTLCFDRKASVILEPCKHRGFCAMCVEMITFCPMCRGEIKQKKPQEDAETNDKGDVFIESVLSNTNPPIT